MVRRGVSPGRSARLLRARPAAAGAALALLTLTACGGGAADPAGGNGLVSNVRVEDGDALPNGVVLPRPYPVPAIPLGATTGGSLDLAAATGTPLRLVFFGYTNCPDVCQTVMASITSALTRLEADQRSEVEMVFVTTDPSRDTVPVLRRYLGRFDPRFVGLTGELDRVVALGAGFDVEVARGRRLPSGGYEVEHGTPVLGLLPDGTAPFVWTDATSPAALAEDLRIILDGEVPLA